MKRNEILGEHKKGIKAVKYNKKPADPAKAHAKAKEKLAPVKPLEEMHRDHRDAYQRDYDSSVSGFGRQHRDIDDEANLMYIYKDGRVKQRMVSNHEERSAKAEGFRGSIEDALRVHGIIRSKFNPKKWVQKQGTQWAEVHPFGKADDVAEGEGQVTASDPTKGVEITNPQTGVKTTIPPKMASALAPDAQNPNRFTLNPQAAAPGASDNKQGPTGPKVGSQVNIPDQATEEDLLAPAPTDSQSPIHGGDEEGHNDHGEIIHLLKKLAGMGMKHEMDNGPVSVQAGIRSDLGHMSRMAK